MFYFLSPAQYSGMQTFEKIVRTRGYGSQKIKKKKVRVQRPRFFYVKKGSV